MEDYSELEPTGPRPNGQPAGHRQLTDSWSRRFARQVNDTEYAVIEVDFYVADAFPEEDGKVVLERQTSYTLCTDPRRPGETEHFSDSRYATLPSSSTPTDADARRACAAFSIRACTWTGEIPLPAAVA
jgi:hypothetical protein